MTEQLLTLSSYTPSQADVVCFKQVKEEPAVEKYPHGPSLLVLSP
jgi:hypothetical protein